MWTAVEDDGYKKSENIWLQSQWSFVFFMIETVNLIKHYLWVRSNFSDAEAPRVPTSFRVPNSEFFWTGQSFPQPKRTPLVIKETIKLRKKQKHTNS